LIFEFERPGEPDTVGLEDVQEALELEVPPDGGAIWDGLFGCEQFFKWLGSH
jgi:hypothetical protein